MFVPTFAFTVREYDPARPWVLTGERHVTVDAADEVDFRRWADETWPRARYRVELDPRPPGAKP